MDNRNEKQDPNDSKPSSLTYLILGLFSFLLGLFLKKKLGELCEKWEITEGEAFFILFIVLWIMGAVLMVLGVVIYWVSLLF